MLIMIIVGTSALSLIDAEMKCLYITEWPGDFPLKFESEQLLLMVLFAVVNWKIGRSGIYLCNNTFLFLEVLFIFSFLSSL